MAESKAKKGAPKVFDVAKPGRTSADATARPVIITNRPVLQDPMMIQVTDDTTETSSSDNVKPVAGMNHGMKLEPLHIDLSEVMAPGAPAVKADTADNVAPKPVSESTDTVEEPTPTAPVDEVAPTVEPDAEPEESKAKPEDKAEPNDAVKVTVTSSTTASAATDKPKVSTGERIIQPLDHSGESAKSADKPAKPSKPEPTAEVAGETTPSNYDNNSVVPPTDDSSNTLSEEAQKAAEAARQLAAEQEKIIAAGTYFLPINAAEKRRTKRHLAIGVALVVLLAVLLFLAMWDAGMVSIPNFEPPTHFFHT